jgi:hypothetical protein
LHISRISLVILGGLFKNARDPAVFNTEQPSGSFVIDTGGTQIVGG